MGDIFLLEILWGCPKPQQNTLLRFLEKFLFELKQKLRFHSKYLEHNR